ncbi:hypothetical protein [Varunaivibrio sulfuroxidans]|uniref:Uncharacterized protein n=1 Tax=Varunaivibrio sulfuroxidans TaxID=1773489 RepID=A0A4R3J5K4_9PROT|nr:hypothetical protein [Varunaivibrio sulfuroxidans]TCS60605.1 hypothetical protein EDD55_11080 [Varunaivibrio sulfuroxidans]WES30094.1 hypothetical protein P3M64_10660 [Varunaivibrio sulfuroxidans]
MAKIFMRIYAAAALVITVVGLAAMFIAPPKSLRADRDGVPYFTPDVLNPATGTAVPMGALIRHYKGN